MSNLSFLKLFPVSRHSIFITSHSIHESITASLQTKTLHRQNEKSHVCLLLTQRNQMLLEPYQLIKPYSNHLNIERNPQGQTTNNSLKSNSSCAPNSWNPNVFTPFTNSVYCRSHSLVCLCSWVLLDALFPFSLSLVQSQRAMTFSWGRDEDKKEGKGGELMFLCQLTSCSTSSVLGSPPGKQTVPDSCILPHHFQTAAPTPAQYCCYFISTPLTMSSIPAADISLHPAVVWKARWVLDWEIEENT